MLAKETYKDHLPEILYKEIEEICASFQDIQRAAASLTEVDEANTQLNTVLKSTEDATNTILDTATAIQQLADEGLSSDENKQKLMEHITRIYEACGFQDLTGQRIMKVLTGLNAMEMRLIKLSEIAKRYVNAAPEEPAAPPSPETLHGPAIPGSGTSQDDVDKLFAS